MNQLWKIKWRHLANDNNLISAWSSSLIFPILNKPIKNSLREGRQPVPLCQGRWPRLAARHPSEMWPLQVDAAATARNTVRYLLRENVQFIEPKLPCLDNRSFQFVNWDATLTMVDHLLKGTPDGIINLVQIRAIRSPYVWVNELHVLTQQVTHRVSGCVRRRPAAESTMHYSRFRSSVRPNPDHCPGNPACPGFSRFLPHKGDGKGS